MKFTVFILPTALFLVSTTNAWTKDGNGVWTANNNYYNIRGTTVHEACTTMNTEDVHPSGTVCAYFVDGVGTIFHGKCDHRDGTVNCLRG